MDWLNEQQKVMQEIQDLGYPLECLGRRLVVLIRLPDGRYKGVYGRKADYVMYSNLARMN